MITFGKALTEILKENKIPVYAIAKQCNIERSLMTRVLSGERKLSTESFARLISQLELSPTEERELRLIYVNNNFGERRYGKYLDFIDKLSRLEEEMTTDSPPRSSIQISLDFSEKTLSFSTAIDTANVIDYILCNEITTKKENCRIYTNIQSKTIFPILFKYKDSIPEIFDFRHLIPISRGKEYDLDTIIETIRFMNFGCLSQYYNADSTPEEHIDQLYPYYIITSEMTLFIGHDFEHSFIIRDSDFADKNAKNFIEKTKNAKQYVNIYSNILECKECYAGIRSLGFDKLSTFGTFCATLHMTEDMWEQIAKADIPGREYLIKTTYEYYTDFFNLYRNNHYIYTKESIDEFVETGIVKNIPTEYADPLTPQNRLRVLENFKKHIEENENDFIIMKDGYLGNIVNFSIEVFSKSDNEKVKHLAFASQTENAPMHYIGNVTCNIDEEKTINDFLEFTKYVAVSGACYSHKESMNIIEDAIHKCRCAK